MPRFLIAIHRPDGYDPSQAEDAAMGRDIDAVNDEMVAAGVRIFVGGLQPPTTARSLLHMANGQVVLTPGLYLGAAEHVGGFWVVEAAHVEEALAWGRKAAIACRAGVEVRPFH